MEKSYLSGQCFRDDFFGKGYPFPVLAIYERKISSGRSLAAKALLIVDSKGAVVIAVPFSYRRSVIEEQGYITVTKKEVHAV